MTCDRSVVFSKYSGFLHHITEILLKITLFVLLSFFFSPLCCLSFDWRILVTPLISSNSSYINLTDIDLILLPFYVGYVLLIVLVFCVVFLICVFCCLCLSSSAPVLSSMVCVVQFVLLLIYIFTFLVPCSDVHYDFRGKTMFYLCYFCLFEHSSIKHVLSIWVTWRVSYGRQA